MLYEAIRVARGGWGKECCGFGGRVVKGKGRLMSESCRYKPSDAKTKLAK